MITLALRAFSEKELRHSFRDIKSFKDACDVLELNQARDPGIPLGTRNDLPSFVMKTTSIAHQHSPG